MKKNLLLITFFFIASLVQAQLTVSLKQGAMFTNSDYIMKDAALTSYYPEVGGSYTFGYLAISASLGVKTIGESESGLGTTTYFEETNGVTTSYTVNDNVNRKSIFTYLAIPVFGSFIYDTRSFYTGIDLGIEANINISAIEKTSGYDDKQIQYVNTFNPDLLLGAKIGFYINRQLAVDLTYRYLYGIFSDVTKDGMFGRIDASALMLGLTYKY